MFEKPKKYNKKEDEENVRLAAQLDLGRCQYCLFVENRKRPGSYPHHIYGRRKRWDLDSIITLCYECHTAVHTARQKDGETEITREKLIKLMEEAIIPCRKVRAKALEMLGVI